MSGLSLEEKSEYFRRTRDSNYQASMKLEGIEPTLDITTLNVLYNQIKSYEDKMWIGFLISREKRKAKSDFRKYLDKCAQEVSAWPNWKQGCLK